MWLRTYFGEGGNELISQLLHFWAFVHHLDQCLFFFVECFHHHFGVLDGDWHTFSRLESMTSSAIILRSNGSEVRWEVVRMVAPKGCRLMP